MDSQLTTGAATHIRRAVAALRSGDTAEAEARFSRVLALDPSSWRARMGLADLASQRGDVDAAADHLRAALTSRRTEPAAALGRLEALRHRPDAAASAFLAGLEFSAGDASCALGLAALLSDTAPIESSPALLAALADLLETDRLDPLGVGPALVRHALADRSADALLSDPSPRPDRRLFLLLLERAPLAHCGIERAVIDARSRFLRGCDDADEPTLLTAIACARQCAATGYLVPPSPDDEAALRDLRGRSDLSDGAVVASLSMGPLTGRIGASLRPAVAQLLEDLVAGPAQEARIADELLGRIAQASATTGPSDSDPVRAQYEEWPYPRWLHLPQAAPLTVGERLRSLLPDHTFPATLDDAVSILIAGCGTGRHALSTAARTIHRGLLGIDISRASLAYAERMRRHLNVPGVTFRHGSIEALEGGEARFELIECVGVLHHLQDPRSGLRALRGCLAAGGVLQVGLYSRAARRCVEAARERLRDAGCTRQDLPAARALLRHLPPGDIAREVTEWADFYAAPGLVDLLFHARERSYDLEEIAALLDDLELEFLGFDGLPAATFAQFDREHLHDGARGDLASWSRFEDQQPDTFANMYVFWVRAR